MGLTENDTNALLELLHHPLFDISTVPFRNARELSRYEGNWINKNRYVLFCYMSMMSFKELS